MYFLWPFVSPIKKLEQPYEANESKIKNQKSKTTSKVHVHFGIMFHMKLRRKKVYATKTSLNLNKIDINSL